MGFNIEKLLLPYLFNRFVPNAPFLYPLKTGKLKVFWCFQGVEKECIGNKWAKNITKRTDICGMIACYNTKNNKINMCKPLSSSMLGDTQQKVKFSIKDFLSKSDQIRNRLQIWSHLLKKTLIENFIFCAVQPLSSYRDFWQVLNHRWNRMFLADNHEINYFPAKLPRRHRT